MRRVVVTGLGAVTPLGVGARISWRRLIAGHSGIVSLTDDGAAKRFSNDEITRFGALPCRVAGLVPRGSHAEGGWDPKDWLQLGDERRMALFTQYAIAAAAEALQDAGYKPHTAQDQESTGVIIGSGIGSLEDASTTSIAYDSQGYKRVPPLFVPRLLINLAAAHVAMRFGLKGPSHSPTSACTTASHALHDAFLLLSHPANTTTHTLLAGAAEAAVHPLSIAGFARARSLSTNSNDDPARASRPFDAHRDGFVMAEGAGVLVLETLERARSRGATILAELKGVGSSCDAVHMTAPAEDGSGAARAMRNALEMARVQPRDVDYVNAHATGTELGDLAENRAVKSVLLGRSSGDEGARTRFKARASDITMSSTKGAVGHLLGAAGAVEAIFTIQALRSGIVPPTLNLDALGTEGLCEGEDWGCDYVPASEGLRRQEVKVALSNSFGFGGVNGSLCFARWDE